MQISQLCHIIHSTWWSFRVFGIDFGSFNNNLQFSASIMVGKISKISTYNQKTNTIKKTSTIELVKF